MGLAAVLGSAAAVRAEDAAPAGWTIHGQSTFIGQYHPAIDAAYSGQNSLTSEAEGAETLTATVFLGHTLWKGGSFYYNPELTQGNGLSRTVGIAGFPDGEGTHAGGPWKVETARYFIRQVIGLGGKTEAVADDQNQIAGNQDVNRITVTIGKLSAADIFDNLSYSHDPRTQFLNWALMDNGAWDYPANSKGYTGGLAVEWNQSAQTFRWGAFLEPAEANAWALDSHLAKAWSMDGEWERRYKAGKRDGAVRVLLFWNHAHMGNYEDAIAQMTPPDVTLTRAYRSKVGAGLSWEQALSDHLGAFTRLGWNDGRTETWAFTEIDETVSGGLSWKGAAWGDPDDSAGVAFVINGLSAEHRGYLADGGYGFIVGDGKLDYATEDILETYYNWQVGKYFALAPDFQFVDHPGYNRARGPVAVFGVRAHVQY